MLCTGHSVLPAAGRDVPETRKVAKALLEEFIAVGGLGWVNRKPCRRHPAYTRTGRLSAVHAAGCESGRALELDALDNAVLDIARLTGVPAPTLENVVACANLLNRRIIEDSVAFRPTPREEAVIPREYRPPARVS